MASVLINCGICGLAVRFKGGQPAPDAAICANPGCQAELARQAKAAEKPEPKAKAKK